MRRALTYCRRYGRAPAGRRLDRAGPLHGGLNGTLIAALTPDGLGALTSVDGAVNGDVFAAYLDQVLGPTLRPGDVVVLESVGASSGRLGRNRATIRGAPALPAAVLAGR